MEPENVTLFVTFLITLSMTGLTAWAVSAYYKMGRIDRGRAAFHYTLATFLIYLMAFVIPYYLSDRTRLNLHFGEKLEHLVIPVMLWGIPLYIAGWALFIRLAPTREEEYSKRKKKKKQPQSIAKRSPLLKIWNKIFEA